MLRATVILSILISFCKVSEAQYAVSAYTTDAEVVYPTIFNDSTAWSRPKKATVLAMVLPGAGQVYNKKLWKAGIVYAGAGALVYSFIINRDSTNKYQSILVNKIDGDSTTIDDFPLLSTAAVTQSRNFYRRNRDFSVVGLVALYALQIIDANVDAHLKEFDINEDLSLKIEPDFYKRRAGIGAYSGLTMRFTF